MKISDIQQFTNLWNEEEFFVKQINSSIRIVILFHWFIFNNHGDEKKKKKNSGVINMHQENILRRLICVLLFRSSTSDDRMMKISVKNNQELNNPDNLLYLFKKSEVKSSFTDFNRPYWNHKTGIYFDYWSYEKRQLGKKKLGRKVVRYNLLR